MVRKIKLTCTASQMHRELIKKLTNLVETNLENENFGPEELAREAGMSQSNLNRKLKSINNQTISQFIREIRLKKAKELLQNEDLTIAEISYCVGFGSPTYFNNCFHEYYGVAPGEMRNREPEIEPEEKPVESLPNKSWQSKILVDLAISLIVVLPLAYFLVNKYSVFKKADVAEKSIAVLPFAYMSNDTTNQYLANGMMDAILLNLSKIKDLRVISRTSVEQYRNSDKTVADIGLELNVAYLLEGSFQKEENQIRLIVQLISTKDENHVWSNNYDRKWEDIFAVQSEVAESVASELQAAITPDEKQLIRKIPTLELTAYDYYQRGIYIFENIKHPDEYTEAKKLFTKCLELDSTYAYAYAMLAQIYLFQNRSETYFSEDYLDSILILADIAISYDDKCYMAHGMKGARYYNLGKPELAIEEFNKALELNPNDPYLYLNLGYIYRETDADFVRSISNFYEAAARQRGKLLPGILGQLGVSLSGAGHYELAKHYFQEKLKLDEDSLSYMYSIVDRSLTEPESSYNKFKRLLEIDTGSINLDFLHHCFATGRYDEAHHYAKKMIEDLKRNNSIPTVFAHRVGYAYWMVGEKEDAKYYFDLQKKIGLESIERGRIIAARMIAYYDLAAVYAFEGDNKNAYKYLEELYKKKVFANWWVQFINHDPLFDNIRNEERFKAVAKHIEKGYQAEHDRVGKWLAEQEML